MKYEFLGPFFQKKVSRICPVLIACRDSSLVPFLNFSFKSIYSFQLFQFTRYNVQDFRTKKRNAFCTIEDTLYISSRNSGFPKS